MDDIIYKQQAIDAMCNACTDWCDEGVCKKTTAIQKLSPVQQERVRGEWKIEHVPYMVGSKNLIEVIICSNCRYVLQGYPSKFCPNCGADMRGEGND